jgi:hypothetical protein
MYRGDQVNGGLANHPGRFCVLIIIEVKPLI